MTSHFLRHGPCSDCGSSDGRAEYSNNTSFCFVCSKWEGQSKYTPADKEYNDREYLVMPLSARKISQKTCQFFDYRVGWRGDTQVHVESYRDKDGNRVAWKFRDKDKNFPWEGDDEKAVLFGRHLWTPNPNISITITEGATDAMSIAEIQDCKWPVVSLKGGAKSAKREMQQNFEWLNGFKEIRLCFDMDIHGQDATQLVAPLFRPGFVKIVHLPEKDANACLVSGKVKELSLALMNAKPYRPDGVIGSDEIDWDEITKSGASGWSTPFPKLNEMTGGIHRGFISLIVAGAGMSKSYLAKVLTRHMIMDHGLKVGVIHLEENLKETILTHTAVLTKTSPEKLKQDNDLFNSHVPFVRKVLGLDDRRMILYDHKGSEDMDSILSKIEFMIVAEECDVIILDHLAELISSLSHSQGDVKLADILMAKLRAIVVRTNVALIATTQPRKVGGDTDFNSGKSLKLSDLRGSQQIAAVPALVIAIEGDNQSENPDNKRLLHVIKNRVTGKTGSCDTLSFDSETYQWFLVPDISIHREKESYNVSQDLF